MNFLYKVLIAALHRIKVLFSKSTCAFFFRLNNVKFEGKPMCKGLPFISNQGVFLVGKNFQNNNYLESNPIGRSCKSVFVVRQNGLLKVGDNCGFSGVAIVCQTQVLIGDNVKIGGNTCIYDTDFHSISKQHRSDNRLDAVNTKRLPVTIGDDVFVGAHVTILKGVTIGEGAVIAACSVVTKDIPPNEVWGGNPVKRLFDVA
jgi:acetyltransferase-like isoleucine patch superfamily enzyme